jgi:hypothetical protein
MVRFPTIARGRWSAVVASLRDLGFNAIDVPLVWREHERAPGVFDFETGPCDIATMVTTVREAGLDLIVRLGPMVTDDAPGLCLPERIFADRRFQARTRRQNPVLVPDPPRLVPLPSIASEAFRDAAVQWVSAASQAIASLSGREGLVRVFVGDGPHGLIRDDPFETDHHPDARGELAAVEPPHGGPRDAADEEIRRETSHAVRYREALLAAAREGGLSRTPIVIAVHGAATISPVAHELAALHPIALPSPPPTAGALATWRQIRHAVALAKHGVHFDLWSGGPAWYPPMRGSHTVAAARMALAAGARDVTVRMGCAGERWIGAVISDTAQSRPHAPMWRELLAWAEALPDGVERCVDLVEPSERVELARAATGVHPLPLGLLALVGLTPGQLSVSDAKAGRAAAMGEHEARLHDAERLLADEGVPFRRVADASSEIAYDGTGSAETLARKAARALDAVRVKSDPPGAALVRAVDDGKRSVVIAVSRSDAAASIEPGDRFTDVHGQPVATSISLEPGAVCVLQRAHEAVKPRAKKKAAATGAPPKKATASAKSPRTHARTKRSS